MKRYLYILFGLIAFGWGEYAQANSMCVANNTVAVILEPTINGNRITTITKPYWGVEFSYGNIYGISTCLTGNPTNETVGGEEQGGRCWCKALHPVQSAWVTGGGHTKTVCVANCATMCADTYVGKKEETRRAMFGSITN